MSRPADYRVAALNKADGRKAQIGRGWKNTNGTISVVIDAFVVITGGLDTLITLFPEDNQTQDRN